MFFDNLHIFLSVPKLFAEFSVVSVLRVLRKTRVWQAYIVYFMVPYIYIHITSMDHTSSGEFTLDDNLPKIDSSGDKMSEHKFYKT